MDRSTKQKINKEMQTLHDRNREKGHRTQDPYGIDFKTKAVKKDKEGHYIMIKGSIQEDITITSKYAPNIY